MRDVTTQSTNTDSRSVTSAWNVNPTPNDASISGKNEGEYLKGVPRHGEAEYQRHEMEHEYYGYDQDGYVA